MENTVFEKICGNFGFGCMRLPLREDKSVDFSEFSEMVDKFLEAGFNYFDTARMYVNGQSEKALKECLCSRYPRDRFVLTDKLSSMYFEKNEDIRPLFEKQLRDCGVDRFDIYLMHCQERKSFEKFKACRAYETALELKAEGKFDCFGISFHDTAEVLEKILTEYPQIEVVQIQFNYLDYDDPSVQSEKCYEVCRKFGKPVIVMEPVKGGSLVGLPEEAAAVYNALGDMSQASYAIRFAAGFENVKMVLSGMGNMEMMTDNLGYMKDFRPLSREESDAVQKVKQILLKRNSISCTACRYCTDGCPVGIDIPELFACYNNKLATHNWNADFYYDVHTQNSPAAKDCIKCGSCENACPQHLPIRELLEKVSKEFDK